MMLGEQSPEPSLTLSDGLPGSANTRHLPLYRVDALIVPPRLQSPLEETIDGLRTPR